MTIDLNNIEERKRISPIKMKVKNRVISIGSTTGGKGGKRGAVKCFSEESAKRLLTLLNSTAVKFTSFITLTLPHVEKDGKVFKDRVNAFLQRLPGKSIWFMEFQKRGSPHLHLYYSEYISFQEVADIWTGLWYARLVDCYGSQMAQLHSDNMREASTQVVGIRDFKEIKGYASKIFSYSAKKEQKDVPLDYEGCGRFWGLRNMKGEMSAATVKSIAFDDEMNGLHGELLTAFIICLSKVVASVECKAYDWKYAIGVMIIFTSDKAYEDIKECLSKIKEVFNDFMLSYNLKYVRNDNGGVLCQKYAM